jgi:hypothetical protein
LSFRKNTRAVTVALAFALIFSGQRAQAVSAAPGPAARTVAPTLTVTPPIVNNATQPATFTMPALSFNATPAQPATFTTSALSLDATAAQPATFTTPALAFTASSAQPATFTTPAIDFTASSRRGAERAGLPGRF